MSTSVSVKLCSALIDRLTHSVCYVGRRTLEVFTVSLLVILTLSSLWSWHTEERKVSHSCQCLHFLRFTHGRDYFKNSASQVLFFFITGARITGACITGICVNHKMPLWGKSMNKQTSKNILSSQLHYPACSACCFALIAPLWALLQRVLHRDTVPPPTIKHPHERFM